jgi:four helix bundle protein
MGSFRTLEVWQRSHSLALSVYRATASLPRGEAYGFTMQMRRAAVSITANLVEGTGRGGDGEFRRFLRISLGSAAELECYLLLANELEFLDRRVYDDLSKQLHAVRGMLVNLLKSLKGRDSRPATRDARR